MSSQFLVRTVAVMNAAVGLYLLAERLRRGIPGNVNDLVAAMGGIGAYLFIAYGLWIYLPLARWMAMGIAGFGIVTCGLSLVYLLASGKVGWDNAAVWEIVSLLFFSSVIALWLLTRPKVRALFAKRAA